MSTTATNSDCLSHVGQNLCSALSHFPCTHGENTVDVFTVGHNLLVVFPYAAECLVKNVD